MAKVLIGFVVLWLVLDRSAAFLESFRGEGGLIVCVLVVGAAIAVESLLFGRRPQAATAAFGLARPTGLSLGIAVAISVALFLFFLIYGTVTGTSLGVMPGAASLALGMFAQGGIAEEIVFRGFLFRHFREGRSFWRAAWLSAIPFVAVHLLLFLTLEFPTALASVALATVISFPLARLFEVGGPAIWAPAILHFAIQAPIKLVVAPETAYGTLALCWMAVSALLPWLVFLAKPAAEAHTAPR
jgi:membrane protease YdiL (CAAX protease family)